MIKNNNKGFSLIELMVVVGIIGILASVAVPNLLKFQAKAKQSNAKTELTALYGIEKAYMVEYNTFTPNYMALGYSPDGVPLTNGCPSAAPAKVYTDGVVPGWPIRYYATGFKSENSSAGVSANNTTAVACTTVSTGNTVGFASLSTELSGTVSAGTASASTSFVAQAIGRISSDQNIKNDTWSITQNKDLTNSTIGY